MKKRATLKKPSPGLSTARKLKVGDWVKVVKIPPDLGASNEIDTPGVFQRALNKTFRIEGSGKYGHIELVVEERRPTGGTYESDTIWIQPEFVRFVDGPPKVKKNF